MQVNPIDSQTNFGSLFIGKTIDKKLARANCSEKFKKELSNIKAVIKNNDFDKKENVDIILNIDEKGKFYGIISSKKEGIPMNSERKCYISNDKKSLDKFSTWLESWNESYNPERLKELWDIIYAGRHQ